MRVQGKPEGPGLQALPNGQAGLPTGQAGLPDGQEDSVASRVRVRKFFLPHWLKGEKSVAALLGALYLALALAYAVRTPPWQSPDEPAHFNYIQDLVEGRGVPELRAGDYDQAYLEELKASHFAEELSVKGLRYEGHQPPLFYLLAAPVALALRDASPEQQVLGVRLISVMAGVALLGVTFAVGRTLFPEEPTMALGVLAFVALLPQHIVMTAAINNDTFAELALSGVLLGSLKLLAHQMFLSGEATDSFPDAALLLGMLLAALLLTTTTVFAGLVLPAMALFLNRRGRPGGTPSTTAWVLASYGTALLLSGFWFLRNVNVYGGLDLLGLARHAQVVTGQPQPVTWEIAQVHAFLATVFQSFWVQPGWTGVPAAPGIYYALATATGVVMAAFFWFLGRMFHDPAALTAHQRQGLLLLGGLFVLVVVQLAVYNLQFMQPQGRYLFPALIPIAVFFALGLREAATPRFARHGFVAVAVGLLTLNLYAQVTLIPYLRPA